MILIYIYPAGINLYYTEMPYLCFYLCSVGIRCRRGPSDNEDLRMRLSVWSSEHQAKMSRKGRR
jgi:hypothetical protein